MKYFVWNGFLKCTNPSETKEYTIYSGNFAKDKDGNSIVRTDEEMERSNKEDMEYDYGERI